MDIKEEYYKIAVENAPIHIILTDVNGKILYANRAVEEITKFTREEIIGNGPELWGQQMDNEFYKELWHTIKEKKEVFEGELTNKRKTGEQYIARTKIKPILENNELKGFVGIEQDITILKKTQGELIQANKQITDLLKSKEVFLNQVAHDLRTPLTPINILIKQLAKTDLTKENKEKMDVVIRNLEYLTELVKETLNIERLDSGRIDFDIHEHAITEIIDETIEMEEPAIKEAGININKKYNKIQNHHVLCDKARVMEVLQNLIANSLKFTPKGGTITFEVTHKDYMVEIKVTDTGSGIKKENIEKIFDEFFKEDPSRHEHSSGLGLAISKRLIEKMHGKIWAESEGKNMGTSMCFTLPMKQR